MLKRSLFLTIAVGIIGAAALLLGSCLPPDAGGKLLVDEDGHFLEDIVYNEVYSVGGGILGKQITTFAQNGSYEMVERANEGEGADHDGDGETDEGWVNEDGEKGTYSWDPITNTLSKTVTKEIVEGEWESLDEKITATELILFTENKYFYVYTKDESDNTLFTYKETEETDSNSYVLESELIIDSESKKIKNTILQEVEDDNGDLVMGNEYETEGSFEVLPAGRVFAVGTTGTLSGESDFKSRSYDAVNEEWGDWSESVTAFSMDFSHTGNFLLVDQLFEGDLGTISSSFRNLDN
jgi:hypothetical protein